MNDIQVCKPNQPSSYMTDEEERAIMFLPCGVVSFNHNDARQHYCARCRRFIGKRFCEIRHATPLDME